MASHRKQRSLSTTRAIRSHAPAVGFTTAALASMTLLSSQNASAAPGDDRPTVEEVQRKVDDLYRQAGTATQRPGRARETADRQRDTVGGLPGGAAGGSETPGATQPGSGARTPEPYGTAPLGRTAALLSVPDVPDAPADHDRRPLGDTPPQRLGERGRTTAPERRAQQADGDRQQADTPRVRETHAVSQDELRSAKRTVQAKLTRGRALLDRLAAEERQRPAAQERRREAAGRHRAEEGRVTAEHAARATEASRQALEAEASDPAQSARALPQAQEARPPFTAPEPAPITAHDAPALPHVPESLELPHTAGAQGLLRAEEPAAHRAQTPALAQATQPHLRDQAFPYARETPALSLMHDIRTPLQAGEQTTPQGAPAPLQAQEPSPAHQAQAPLTAQEPPPAQEAFASRVGPEPDQAQEGHAPCWSPERLPVCEQVWGPQTATAWAPLPREASPVTGAGAAPESGGDGGGRAADADAGHAAKADKVLAFARAQIGKPCVRGATGPSSYDCAGLTQAAWRAAGVDLPRGADAQAESGRRVSAAELLPGDLVFFSEDGGRVGVYAGGGMVIHALAPGAAVREEPLSALPLHGAVRPA